MSGSAELSFWSARLYLRYIHLTYIHLSLEDLDHISDSPIFPKQSLIIPINQCRRVLLENLSAFRKKD